MTVVTSTELRQRLDLLRQQIEAHPDPGDEPIPNRRGELTLSLRRLRERASDSWSALERLEQSEVKLEELYAERDALVSARDAVADELSMLWGDFLRGLPKRNAHVIQWRRLRDEGIEKGDREAETVAAEELLRFANVNSRADARRLESLEAAVDLLAGRGAFSTAPLPLRSLLPGLNLSTYRPLPQVENIIVDHENRRDTELYRLVRNLPEKVKAA